VTRGPSDEESGIEILEIVGYDEPEERPQPPGPQEPSAGGTGKLSEVVVRLSRAREEGRLAGMRELLKGVLPALDALESCVREKPDAATLEHAVRLALRQIWDVFRQHELERIEGSGVPFDPSVHEAAQITSTERVPPNTVLEVMRVGYALGGALVRPALVRVSAEPGAAEGPVLFDGRIGGARPGAERAGGGPPAGRDEEEAGP